MNFRSASIILIELVSQNVKALNVLDAELISLYVQACSLLELDRFCSSRIKGCPQANYTWIQIQECSAHSNKSNNLTHKRNLLIVVITKRET